MKIIGQKKERTPKENLEVQEELIQNLRAISPLRKKKGFVLKFKTWSELEEFSKNRYTFYYDSTS